MRNLRTSCYLSGDAYRLLSVDCGRCSPVPRIGDSHSLIATSAAIAFWFETDNQSSVRADR